MLKSIFLSGSLSLCAFATPVFADAGALDTVRSECATQLNLPAPACDCIVGKVSELNENQQAFVAAMVTKDEATAAALRPQMGIDELTQVGMFMTSAPQACMQGG